MYTLKLIRSMKMKKLLNVLKMHAINLQLIPRLISTHGGSDNNRYVKEGIRGIVVACAMNDCHSVSEYTTIDELEKSALLALHLMID